MTVNENKTIRHRISIASNLECINVKSIFQLIVKQAMGVTHTHIYKLRSLSNRWNFQTNMRGTQQQSFGTWIYNNNKLRLKKSFVSIINGLLQSINNGKIY